MEKKTKTIRAAGSFQTSSGIKKVRAFALPSYFLKCNVCRKCSRKKGDPCNHPSHTYRDKKTYTLSTKVNCQNFYQREKEKGKNKSIHELVPGCLSVNKKGYVLVYIPQHPKANAGYVFEHRFVVEKIINRFLTRQEHIHHKDSNRQNNAPENLLGFSSNSAHRRWEACGEVAQHEIFFDYVRKIFLIILLSSFCITAHADEIDDIIPAIIQVESGGNPNAVSPQGCIGLMQINPNGALKEWNQAFAGKESVYTIGMSEDKRKAFYLTSEDMKNPKWNKRVGRWYLEKLRFYYLAKVIERKKKPCRIRYNNDVWLKAETVDVEYSLSLILAAYNGGTGRLKKCNYDIDCMPKETQNYVRKVMKIYKHTEVSQCLKK
ncbi:MAG: transglycosylase SLT domain-containing protein [Veillonellales bacterium]